MRTIFHVVNPLANPAGALAQVIGVHSATLVPKVAEAMVLLGTRHGFVVHGDGLDELSISGLSEVAEVREGEVRRSMLDVRTLGLVPAPVEALRGGDAQENAAILREVFDGVPGPRRDIVVLQLGRL